MGVTGAGICYLLVQAQIYFAMGQPLLDLLCLFSSRANWSLSSSAFVNSPRAVERPSLSSSGDATDLSANRTNSLSGLMAKLLLMIQPLPHGPSSSHHAAHNPSDGSS